MSDALMEMSHSIRRVCLKYGNIGFEVTPKLYFEFLDMGKMKNFEVLIMQDMSPYLMGLAYGEPIKKVDRDTVEMQIGGVSIILRCMKRVQLPAGVDAGYNDVKFINPDLMDMGSKPKRKP